MHRLSDIYAVVYKVPLGASESLVIGAGRAEPAGERFAQGGSAVPVGSPEAAAQAM